MTVLFFPAFGGENGEAVTYVNYENAIAKSFLKEW
jgi:hypothetical protein